MPALANAGGVTAFLPLLSLLLPMEVGAVAGGSRLGVLTAGVIAGALAASVANRLRPAERPFGGARRRRRRWLAGGITARCGSVRRDRCGRFARLPLLLTRARPIQPDTPPVPAGADLRRDLLVVRAARPLVQIAGNVLSVYFFYFESVVPGPPGILAARVGHLLILAWTLATPDNFAPVMAVLAGLALAGGLAILVFRGPA